MALIYAVPESDLGETSAASRGVCSTVDGGLASVHRFKARMFGSEISTAGLCMYGFCQTVWMGNLDVLVDQDAGWHEWMRKQNTAASVRRPKGKRRKGNQAGYGLIPFLFPATPLGP